MSDITVSSPIFQGDFRDFLSIKDENALRKCLTLTLEIRTPPNQTAS